MPVSACAGREGHRPGPDPRPGHVQPVHRRLLPARGHQRPLLAMSLAARAACPSIPKAEQHAWRRRCDQICSRQRGSAAGSRRGVADGSARHSAELGLSGHSAEHSWASAVRLAARPSFASNQPGQYWANPASNLATAPIAPDRVNLEHHRCASDALRWSRRSAGLS